MRNLVLRSLILALLTIPFVAARDPHPRRSLKKALLLFVGFNLLYMLALRFLYPVLS
jgi:hypothetical protein